MTPADRIRKLIDEAEGWRREHIRRRDEPSLRKFRHENGLEALACSIRLKALEDCLAVVDPGERT